MLVHKVNGFVHDMQILCAKNQYLHKVLNFTVTDMIVTSRGQSIWGIAQVLNKFLIENDFCFIKH